MRKLYKLSYVLLFILVLGACSDEGFKPDYKLKIEPFSFTNQHEQEVTLEDLKGEVWLAQFVFSNCTTACGPMMANMAKLQDMLIEENVEDYKIVSFTVDPVVDSPEVLQVYLDNFEPSDESKWEMLTGYRQDLIFEIAKKSFATIVTNIPGDDQVMHGTSFSLVNQNGEVVKSYSGQTDVPYEDIVKDMKALIKSGS